MAKKKSPVAYPVVPDEVTFFAPAEATVDSAPPVEKPMPQVSQAEFDASILIQAQDIRRDPKRFMAARAVNPSILA
jgi:hypothetical protein